MKVYLSNSKYFMDDNGNVVELTPNDDRYLKLPANSVNRTWVSCVKVDKAPGQCVDYGNEVKVARTLTQRDESTPRKGLEEYLEGEDKETYLKLVEKAKANREAANKKTPMTDLEKAQRRLERAQANLAKVQAQQTPDDSETSEQQDEDIA